MRKLAEAPGSRRAQPRYDARRWPGKEDKLRRIVRSRSAGGCLDLARFRLGRTGTERKGWGGEGRAYLAGKGPDGGRAAPLAQTSPRRGGDPNAGPDPLELAE